MATTATSSADVDLPDAEELARLKLSPEVAWYLLSRGMQLPDCPPLIKTEEPRDVVGAAFDPAKVDRVLKAFGVLRHTKGKWAGTPLKPDPWQVAYVIAPVFGWVRFDADADKHVRIINELYVDLPRKNGKSTIVGGIGIYMTAADGEPGAEVIAAATTKDQAKFVFDPIRHLADKAPGLKGKVKAYKDVILHPKSGSYFKAISSIADAQHGANLHAGLIDELHVHKSPDMVETLETGTGSRDQPLIVIITTADSGRRNTVYDTKRRKIEQLARGVLTDPSVYGVIWAVPEKDQHGERPFLEEVQRAANPGFGISPTRAYLARAATKAKQSPAELASYLRLHLGVRTKQETKFLSLEAWDRNASLVTESALGGREAYGGLDLGSTSDLCALCWLFPDDADGYDALWRFWTPEENLRELDKRTSNMASVWVRQGFLATTPGNVADYDFIRTQIDLDLGAFDVRGLGFDPWNATPLTNKLLEDGAPMVKTRQGFITQSPPLKELQRLLLKGTSAEPLMRHGGNPVMRWMVDNLAVEMDAAGNVKPSKKTSGEKIDGVSALNNAFSEAMTREPVQRSAYDDDDAEVLII